MFALSNDFMKAVSLIVSLIVLGFLADAQVTVQGQVRDTRNRPLRGVSVILKDTYDGAVTDSLGKFQFTTEETGALQLEASIAGYRAQALPIQLPGNVESLRFELKELITELNAVVITAGSFEASDKAKGAVLNSIDIVTTPSANADVTSAFRSLPGTQQVGESEGLFVRGGTASESKIYIDGALVNNFFFSPTPGIATRGRFNPFLFKGTVFSTGGYSALYGQALSSALLLESVDLPDQSSADVGVSVVGLSAGFQQLAKNKKSSWGVTASYSNLWLAFSLIKQRQDFYQVPVSGTFDANFRIKTKRGGMIKYYGYLATNKVGFRNTNMDSIGLLDAFRLRNINTYHNLNWKERLGKGWRMQGAVSFSVNRDRIGNKLQDELHQPANVTNPLFLAFQDFNVENRAKYMQARLVLEKKLGGLSAIRFGTDYFYSREDIYYTAFNGFEVRDTITDHLKSLFAETDVYITNRLALKTGVRVEHTTLLDRFNLAPRFSLAYKLSGNTSASFAYGIFYQNPETRTLPAPVDLGFARADHYILQVTRQANDRLLRVEAFYKDYRNLYRTGLRPIGTQGLLDNQGSGYAQGIELFWRDKKTLKSVDYWISYSYLDTRRLHLNYPMRMQPNFATNHTASVVFKRFVTKWKTGFNASYNFATGRPFYHIGTDNTTGQNKLTDRGTTIAFNSLSFSVNFLPNLGKPNKKAFAVWVLSVNNVLNQKQVFNYRYSTDGNRREAITPPARQFVFIGCFLSFGVDRTQEAINNNL